MNKLNIYCKVLKRGKFCTACSNLCNKFLNILKIIICSTLICLLVCIFSYLITKYTVKYTFIYTGNFAKCDLDTYNPLGLCILLTYVYDCFIIVVTALAFLLMFFIYELFHPFVKYLKEDIDTLDLEIAKIQN